MQPHTPSFGFTATTAGQGPVPGGPIGAVQGGISADRPPGLEAQPVAPQPDITAHVEALLGLRDGEGVRRYRAQLDDETARRVINDPRIPKERRGALSLAKAFAGNPRYGETSKIIPVDSTPEQG